MRSEIIQPGYGKGRESINKGQRFPAEVLTGDEVRRLLGVLSDASSLGLRNRAMITVLYRSGLRHSEALALMPKDLDLVVGSITVLHGKGDKRRVVGIDAGAAPILEAWDARRTNLGFGDSEPLFCTLRGTRMSSSYLRGLLPRLAKEADISKRVHPHGLRHTHAYELAMERVGMPIIQRQLGRFARSATSLATTDRYLNHIAPQQVIEAIGRREWEL